MTNKIVILDNSVELYEHYIDDTKWERTLAFPRCNGLTEVIFEGTTPPTFTNQIFHDYCPPVIYVPDSAVSDYRAIAGSVWTNQTWSTNIIQPISNR